MTLKDIFKFKRLNVVSTNGIDNKQVLPLRLTSDKKEKHVLYMQDSRNDSLRHFAWIKIYSVSWDRKLLGTKTKNFSAIDNYIWKKLL